MAEPLEFRAPTRIVFGAGSFERLGALALEQEGRRALLVCDAGIRAAGYFDEAAALLGRSGLEVVPFHDFDENPTSDMIERGTAAARDGRIDLLVAVGGGSSLDSAKGINFLLTNGGRMVDYWGYGKAERPMLPMIAVPTTAGTGSEMQSYALISDPETHRKMACGDSKAYFRVAILEPRLTATQPVRVTASAGYDAIGHAVEAWVTTRRTPLSGFFAREAWRLLGANFERVLAEPNDLDARGAMLLGASLAGIAIENSMLGATHALANPLTVSFGTTHGVAIAILLRHVVRWNSETADALYRGLLDDGGPLAGGRVAARLEELLAASGLPRRLRDVGIAHAKLPELARASLQEWTGRFNPRALTEEAALALYEAAY